MERTAAVLGTLMGGPLVILCIMWAITWMVSRAFAARNEVDSSTSHSSSEEARDVEMVVFRITEDQAENSDRASTFTNIPNTSLQEEFDTLQSTLK